MSDQQVELAVSLNQRYASAWAEIGQRINARQSVYVQFASVMVTVVFGVLGAWVTGLKDPHSWLRAVAEWGGSIGLTVYTWVFALWIRHNDALIGLLGVFCKTLERRDGGIEYPAWHIEDQGWIVLARHHRKKSDIAAASLGILVCCVIAIFVIIRVYSCELPLALGLLVVFGVECAAVKYLFESAKFRAEIASYDDKIVRDKAAQIKGSC
jgi:hypothetical protein